MVWYLLRVIILSSAISFVAFLLVFVFSLYGFLVVLIDFIGHDFTVFSDGADGVLLVILTFFHDDIIPVLVTFWRNFNVDAAFVMFIGIYVGCQGFIEMLPEFIHDSFVSADDFGFLLF